MRHLFCQLFVQNSPWGYVLQKWDIFTGPCSLVKKTMKFFPWVELCKVKANIRRMMVVWFHLFWLCWFSFILKDGKLELRLWRMRRWDYTGNWGASQFGVTTHGYSISPKKKLLLLSSLYWSDTDQNMCSWDCSSRCVVPQSIFFFQVLSTWNRQRSSLIKSYRDKCVTQPCSPPTKNPHLQLSVLPDDLLWGAYVLIYFWFVFY